ncbi:MAG: hypothetical protein M1818_006023 [Claussenomyces sp. TS43310]|nr:MAG: hypothetical protein M1818_006023 [Claussenomyces sp. TS43310]
MATIFLWQPEHSRWGFLSQWYESPFHTGGKEIIFHTAEQYMMHHKALLFSDHETAAKILTEKDPKTNQELGRGIKNFDKSLWLQHRERIVEEGSYHKFTHSLVDREDLKALFLATGDQELVEASPVDRIWGVGYGEEDAHHNRPDWGSNLLGKALSRARDRIRREQEELKTGSRSQI